MRRQDLLATLKDEKERLARMLSSTAKTNGDR
jgi:hypothetical protein